MAEKNDPADAPKVRRRRRPSITSDQLLERAFELFVDLGYEGTSIDVITAEAGVAKRTIYSRYGDKESLFKASLQHEIGRWASALDALEHAETNDLEETLIKVGQILLDNVLSPAGLRLLQMTGSVARRMPEIGAHNVEQGTKPILVYLTDLFRRRIGAELYCFSSHDDAAMAFMNLVVAGPANIVAQGQTLDDQFKSRYVKSSVCLFLRGMQSPASDRALSEVEAENLHLKKLLAETMIELDTTRRMRGAPSQEEKR